MLCRRYGTTLATTPMIDPAGYCRSEKYRKEFEFYPEDRPLVVQFGGSSSDDLVAASRLVAPHCDAIEINCGCPQRCARQGGYGVFLMEDPDKLEGLVKALATAEGVPPVFVKIRVFDDVAKTVALALRIEAAGAKCLTVHGRTRQQGGGRSQDKDRGANWETIAAVKAAVRTIPVVSNGNIRDYADVERCLAATSCDGVMSGCGLLACPTLFARPASGSRPQDTRNNGKRSLEPRQRPEDVDGGGGLTPVVSGDSDGSCPAAGNKKGKLCHGDILPLAAAAADVVKHPSDVVTCGVACEASSKVSIGLTNATRSGSASRNGDGGDDTTSSGICTKEAGKDKHSGHAKEDEGELSAAPLPQVSIAVEYLQLALKYRASHQQITKHLQTYLGPLFRALMKQTTREFRGENHGAVTSVGGGAAVSKDVLDVEGKAQQQQQQQPQFHTSGSQLNTSSKTIKTIAEEAKGHRDSINRYRGEPGDAAAIGELTEGVLKGLGELARRVF